MKKYQIFAATLMLFLGSTALADATGVGETQVRTGQEIENTHEMKKEAKAEAKVEQRKKLVKARKKMDAVSEDAKTSGAR